MTELHTLTWQYVVGLVEPADLPMAAAHLLAAGLDSSALRDLAGRSRGDSTDEVFREALHQLGTTLPDERTADLCLLHDLAGRLAAGEITAGEVAGEVWYRCLSGDTEAEREFLETVGPEYWVESLAYGPPEGYQAWKDAVRSAAERLCRAEAPLR
ncbi:MULTISPECIES: hypothetical protein [Kitasatospora]|uniref:DUF4240 domain-containing protein n=1 Tax=Kitasatospora cathayae TaxID=3004092 RepID=A0ABY7PZ48_9ACTN|nr:hypothetical protein [Kitasatospora sp. HUAS 3-15]WBP85625.1 hypothetical protein O1G21_07010 [Kitasatospora sp. HUAS 3-15]